jgi:predicted RNA-binding protein with RPS1 domain
MVLVKKEDKKISLIIREEKAEPELREDFIRKIRRREKQKTVDFKP